MNHDTALRITMLLLFGLGITASGILRRRADRLGGVVPRSADGRRMQVALGTAALVFYGALLARLIHPPAIGWAAVPLPLAARWLGAALLVRVRREETELVRVFGAAYVEYMARAGRIVPWIGRRR